MASHHATPAVTIPAVTTGKGQVRLSAAKYDELLRKAIDFGGKHEVAKNLYSMGCPVAVNNGRIEAEDGWVIEVETTILSSEVTLRWHRKAPSSYRPKPLTSAEINDRCSRAYQKARNASRQPTA